MYNPEESGPLIPPKGRHTRETSYGSADVEGALGGRSSRSSSTGGEENVHFTPISSRAWSFQDQRRHMAGSDSPAAGMKLPHPHLPGQPEESSSSNKEGPQRFLYYLVYAAVNMIISAPSLYGYAAVIFNNPVFDTHMNALSKLVLFSSLVHQLGFLLFSSLDFAIGTVQDAGLIFLSSMANTIADIMVDDGHSEAEIVSTTLVLLCAGTALLGIVLIVMGKTGVADVVSFLPMPVVGGYLAFIGYFCFQAGVALCISTPLIELSDWLKVFHPKNMILATPGMIAGLILTYTSFKATNSAVLPAVMVAIPTAFYLVIWGTGIGLEGAREAGWVGEVAPSVPVTDLFKLVDFSLVRWDLWTEIVGTWVGMVFVVSFASCLDVAAISLDMGQALDTNRELATVGMCNFMSGLTLGFTGSYIFSQTIFTFRTGVHSRWIGVLIIFAFAYIVCSPVNVLEVSPLFFLGSTLIFIGYALVWEWLWEVRHQVFLSEYGIIWFTFIIIQFVGIDAGIILGVLIAIFDNVVVSARNSGINRVQKTSRAVWTPADAKILHDHAYTSDNPKIVTLEVIGTVFFGSSLSLLSSITDEIGLGTNANQGQPTPGFNTPQLSNLLLTPKGGKKPLSATLTGDDRRHSLAQKRPPKYLVLDLRSVSHLDASATRGTFLQLANLCAKQDIIVCCAGVSPKIVWMLRSHGVSIKTEEEEGEMKARLLSRKYQHRPQSLDKILIFITVQEALEFCETALVHRYNIPQDAPSLSARQKADPEANSIGSVIAHILGMNSKSDKEILKRLDGGRYHEEMSFKKGDMLFQKRTHSDSFFIVLTGTVANTTKSAHHENRQRQPVVSGAGLVKQGSSESLPDSNKALSRAEAASFWHVGGVFGYVDFLLERPRLFRALASVDGTRVAKFSFSGMNLLEQEDKELYGIMQRVLLHASTIDLTNCTCSDV